MKRKLSFVRIIALQLAYGVTKTQDGINSGDIWMWEGSVGRFANDMLEAGICMLPTERTRDYYGGTFPSRYDVKPGTKGSFAYCQDFWQKVEDGDYETIDALEETFGVAIE